MDSKELTDKDWFEKYVYAYYFSTVTMYNFIIFCFKIKTPSLIGPQFLRITVGYGDILPTNTDEMILCCFTMLIACGVFGYSLNVIGSIISDILAKD
jgi:hypothetical protein